MQRTKIEFADYSYNPIVGCSKISTGCKNCFAEAMVNRFPWMTGTTHYPDELGQDANGWDNRAHFFPDRLEEPFHLRPGKDRPHRIFVCSMSDLFHESLSNEHIAAVFGVMAATPQHQYVVLTKRLQRALEWFEWVDDGGYNQHICNKLSIPFDDYFQWPLPNVIIGASVENQKAADERIPLLLQIPARWRGVSVEPMLGTVDLDSDKGGTLWIGGQRGCDGMHHGIGTPECPMHLHHHHDNLCRNGIDLVICGAETGPKKRPFKDEWAMDLLDQCKAAGTPFFFKKDGNGNGTLCGVEYHEWIGE
jgi:protein gp37